MKGAAPRAAPKVGRRCPRLFGAGAGSSSCRAAQGIADLSEAIRSASSDLRAYINRGWAYEVSGDQTRAISWLR